MVQVKDTMERLWIIWIVIGYLVNVGDTLLRAQCQHEGYFQTVHENYRLKNYVISSTDVQSLFDCVMACMNEGRCSSYNFQVSGNPLHKCELNSRSQSSAKPGSLELRNGFQYYEEVVHSEEHKVCESVSCFNGGSCEEKCVGFPYSQCRCPKGYTGIYCEKLESGNFLLKLTSSNVHDYSTVFVNRKKFKTFTSCVWLKPNSSEGVVFTYATKDDPMEMAMFFNQSSVIVHLSGVVIVKNLALPINKWSHLCIKLENGQKFSLYHNSYRVSGFVNITEKVVGINGDGVVVAGFKQTSPGKIVYSASSNLFLSRLYFWNYRIYELDMFRLYNEPQVSRFNKPSFVNWKMFYKPQLPLNTTVIYPVTERLQGNFDLKFSGLQHPVIINFTMVESKLNAFTLCLWVRTTNQADDSEPSLFTLKSGSDTIMKLVFISNEHKYDFTLLNVTWRIPGIPANGEWHHFCATWRKSNGVVNMFLNGIVQVAKSNIYSGQTLQEISSATVELGGSYFIGEMTDVNVWFKLFGFRFIGLLALQPGNAMGDLFAWTMLEENKDTRKVSPSAFPKRGDFDMKFPQPKENSVNYIYLESPYSIYTGHQFACSFWIKISLDASPFTLISYAIPSQVNEFNVHFGTNGIWVHVNGKKRFISIERQAIVGKWHHFLFNWYGHSEELACWHNNRVIFRDKGIGVGIIQRKDGVLVVGAQQTKHKIISKKEYQFYGQLSQLQVWVRNIHSSLARSFAARCSCIPGNFFSWSDMPVGINGTIEISHSSECLEIKNGEEE